MEWPPEEEKKMGVASGQVMSFPFSEPQRPLDIIFGGAPEEEGLEGRLLENSRRKIGRCGEHAVSKKVETKS